MPGHRCSRALIQKKVIKFLSSAIPCEPLFTNAILFDQRFSGALEAWYWLASWSSLVPRSSARKWHKARKRKQTTVSWGFIWRLKLNKRKSLRARHPFYLYYNADATFNPRLWRKLRYNLWNSVTGFICAIQSSWYYLILNSKLPLHVPARGMNYAFVSFWHGWTLRSQLWHCRSVKTYFSLLSLNFWQLFDNYSLRFDRPR